MTPTKEKALAALLTCSTKKEAAAQAGISDRTLRAYFTDPAFQEAYQRAFGGVVEDATRQAQKTLAPALSTLQEIMEDADIPAAARVSAAKAALEYAIKLTETNDFAARLEAVERMTQEGNA